MTFDLDGNILNLNAAARRLHSVSVTKDTSNLKASDLTTHWYLDGQEVGNDDTPTARVLRGETFTEYELWTRTQGEASHKSGGESRRTKASGERRWLGAYSGTQVEDSITLGVLSVRDVTAVRELEARFRATFEVNPTAISIVRLSDLRFNDVNESFLELTGYSREEVIGKTAADLGIFLEYGKRETALRQMRRNGGDRVIEHEAAMRTKGGEQRQILSEGRIVLFNGNPHLIDTYLDITDRKRSENELMQAIQATMSDTSWFTRVVMEKLAEIRAGGEAGPGLEQLTKREQGVLELLAQGQNNEQIAQVLGLSKHTIRNYVATIYSKLGVRSRAEAVIWARERGLIFPN